MHPSSHSPPPLLLRRAVPFPLASPRLMASSGESMSPLSGGGNSMQSPSGNGVGGVGVGVSSLHSPSSSSSGRSSPSSLLHAQSIEDRMARTHGSRANILSYWWRHRMQSHDRVERHYSFLIAMLIASTVLFALIKTQGTVLMWGSPICTLWSACLIVVTLGNVWAEQHERWGVFELTRLVQFVLAMLSVLIYYDGSNVINRYRYAQRGDAMLYDETLLAMDEAIWGWLWPKGQMALWLDTQTDFGVTTQIGRVYAELFQILYVSYYFWGNAIGVILAYKYFYYCVWKKQKGTRKRLQWRCIQMFVSAWVGAFVFNHLINLCFPAVSPRIYLKDHYKNNIEGLWILASMRNAITNAAANTFSAFPSGHCGLSILAILLAFRIHLSTYYTWAVSISTVLIVLATQVLRYHYFVDFLFSLVVVAFGAWLGGFHDWELYQQCLEQMGLEDHDDEGKPMTTPGYEKVPLIAPGGRSSPSGRMLRNSGGIPQAAGAGAGDVEMGNVRSSPPLVLSSAVFGMTRSVSSQQVSKDAQKGAEEAV